MFRPIQPRQVQLQAGQVLANAVGTIRLPPETPNNPLRTTGDVSRLLAESINQVRRGQLDVRAANTVGFLAGILLKALEQSRVEDGLTHLEAILGCKKDTQAQVFHFIAGEETHEQSSTTAEDN